MNTQQIQFFLTAANCLNFTEAARKMFVAQPTLSKQIALLEEEVGARLFYRNNRIVTLTPAGVLLKRELSSIEHQINSMLERARRIERGYDGHLSIGILDVVESSENLIGWINEFHRQYAGIDITIGVHGFKDLVDGLRNGSFDVILNKGFEIHDIPGIESIPVRKSTPAVLVHKNSHLAALDHLAVLDLKDEYFIVLDQSEATTASYTLFDLCQSVGFHPKIRKFARNNASRIMYVALGFGITLADLEIELHANTGIRKIPVIIPSQNVFTNIEVVMAWATKNYNPTIDAFRDLAPKLNK